MIGSFGTSEFGSTEFLKARKSLVKLIALLGDDSNHGGSIISSGHDGTFLVNGIEVAVDGALHSCPIEGHNITSISPITVRSYVNGKLILTKGAKAGCGAKILPGAHKVFVE
jgi:uncharacterized Zn-binding protein involved in type VI secretion